MTPSEVVAAAFENSEAFDTGKITPATILEAQRKFLRPALGNLYGPLLADGFPDLLEEYLKAPLALYVKWLVMPSLAVQCGNTGIVTPKADTFSPADARPLAHARRAVKVSANALLRCAVEHIAANPQRYPGFEPGRPVRATGGIVF